MNITDSNQDKFDDEEEMKESEEDSFDYNKVERVRYQLSDFGVSKIKLNKFKTFNKYTKNPGNLELSAPEVILGGSYGTNSDIFSAGHIIYYSIYM